jgi:hypothetical protein
MKDGRWNYQTQNAKEFLPLFECVQLAESQGASGPS